MSLFKKPSKEFWRVLLISAVVGLSAGALGALSAWSVMLAYQTNLTTRDTLTTASNRRRAIGEEQLLQTIREETSLSVADIFLVKTDPDARYMPEEAIGHGVVLTNDGWILSHRSAVDPKKKSALRVGVGAMLVSVERIIEDAETGVLFLKIKADNLHAAVFGLSGELLSGDRLYGIRARGTVRSARVDQTRARSSLESASDTLETKLSLIPSIDSSFVGMPILNARGEVVGITTEEAGQISAAVPSDQIAPLFSVLFAKEKLIRPSLGVRGLSLDGSRTEHGRERGFLVIGNERTGARAVSRGSPAERAGIRAGDIIIKLGNFVLSDRELSETLLAYKPGEEVELTIMRDGKEMTMRAVLGERDSGKMY